MRAIRGKKPAPKTVVKRTAPTTESQTPSEKAAKQAKPLTLKPRVSEKAYGLSESRNTYVFDIESGINKFDVAEAVGAQYDVTVTGVRLASLPGKAVRTYRQKGRRSLSGQRSATRKAYVT